MSRNLDRAANVAMFLISKTSNVHATWHGTIPAAQQRELFGRYLGKGQIWIDGTKETIEHYRKVCFGLDSECTAELNWRDL